jgi:hypothetical protein
MLQDDGHKLILWTVREGDLLRDAIQWCREKGLEFYAANKDYPEEEEQNNNHFSRKLKADIWIDDRNIGGLPDWGTIYQIIKNKKTYEEIIYDKVQSEDVTATKMHKWWQFWS